MNSAREHPTIIAVCTKPIFCSATDCARNLLRSANESARATTEIAANAITATGFWPNSGFVRSNLSRSDFIKKASPTNKNCDTNSAIQMTINVW